MVPPADVACYNGVKLIVPRTAPNTPIDIIGAFRLAPRSFDKHHGVAACTTVGNPVTLGPLDYVLFCV